MNETTTTTYYTCPETAKLIRKALKQSFPGVKFSVRSDQYSMGASIRVRWTDGPRQKVVESVAGEFAGATFDGMTDCKNYHSDTHVKLDGNELVEVRVRYGADFVFCDREITNESERVAEAEATIRAHCLIEPVFSKEGDLVGEQFGNRWISDLALSTALDRDADETMRQSMERVVLNHGREA